jgi:hypothetical protein
MVPEPASASRRYAAPLSGHGHGRAGTDINWEGVFTKILKLFKDYKTN